LLHSAKLSSLGALLQNWNFKPKRQERVLQSGSTASDIDTSTAGNRKRNFLQWLTTIEDKAVVAVDTTTASEGTEVSQS
jgi:hypothetical protein